MAWGHVTFRRRNTWTRLTTEKIETSKRVWNANLNLTNYSDVFWVESKVVFTRLGWIFRHFSPKALSAQLGALGIEYVAVLVLYSVPTGPGRRQSNLPNLFRPKIVISARENWVSEVHPAKAHRNAFTTGNFRKSSMYYGSRCR